MTFISILAILTICGIVYCLGSSLYYLVQKGSSDSQRNHVAKALSWRIGLSLLAFALLLFAHYQGWIQFHQAGFTIPQ